MLIRLGPGYSFIMNNFFSFKVFKYSCKTDCFHPRYTRQIENILRQFEAVYQWADIFSALNKLRKTIQSNQTVPFIPRKQKVAKRLALCLLEKSDFSSVHKAAVGVYEEIFKTLGPNRLAQDLFIYTAGLFPALEYIDLGAKDHILKLYDTYLGKFGIVTFSLVG